MHTAKNNCADLSVSKYFGITDHKQFSWNVIYHLGHEKKSATLNTEHNV